jgi:hypothetical protein
MFRVDDIYDEAKKVIGACDDKKLFSWLGDAVSLIANKGDFEGWKGYLDICTAGCACGTTGSVCNSPASCGRRCVTLPAEVDLILGVNIGGQPTLGKAALFEFHLNGPGSCRTVCDWSWMDQGKHHCTYRDLIVPAKLIAYLATSDDDNCEFVVFGYDDKGQMLRRNEGGVWKNGYRVPTVYGYAIPDADAPTVARITGIYKARTVGNVRLSTVDDSGITGTLLGIYEPDETTPQFRRIKLNRCCNWVRIAYMKTNPTFFSKEDHVPLRSRLALLLAVQARKHYNERLYDLAHSCEADAARLELESQTKVEPQVLMPVQVVDMNQPRDKYDYDIR